jgi:serine/threonine protein kinase
MSSPLLQTGKSQALVGIVLPSESHAGVRYCFERVVGEGWMGTAYLARRETAEGASPVVVKVMHEEVLAGEIAPEVVAAKEAVALGRLNESVPPTPFVVRFIDAGTLTLGPGVRVPWTAIEYVHGGIEGTTLEDRVTYSVHKTGYAFDPVRTAHAVRCLSAGLSAIHAVGVLHRDLTPGNVLCCGFGLGELFKIADFGVARATGNVATFEGLCVGTVGYSPPEAGGASAGPATDVFALAAVVYYLLTGQRYFAADSPIEAVSLIVSTTRPRLADHPTLSPDFAHHPEVCDAIDQTLARATTLDPRKRPATPALLAAELLAALGEHSVGPRSSRELRSAVQSSRSTDAAGHRFSVRAHRHANMVIESAAWDVDGHALALVGDSGLFWNGDSWLDAAPVLARSEGKRLFTQHHEAGGWLLGGDVLCVLDARGLGKPLAPSVAGTRFTHASGRLDELLLAAGVDASGTAMLWPILARRFLKPLPLGAGVTPTTLQRLDEGRFLLGGRRASGGAVAALVSPLEWELTWLAPPDARAFIGGASEPERGAALLTGSEGVVLRVEQGAVSGSVVPGHPNLSAAAMDVLGREWVASPGALWTRHPAQGDAWQVCWHDPSWVVPFISLMAEPGLVLAMTADGGIVEGRATTG